MEANIEKSQAEQRIRSDLLLLLVALIWGVAFVAQRSAANQLGVFMFTGLRFLLGALALLPFALRGERMKRADLRWMFLAGGILFAASTLQQAGLRLTTAGNAGFITTLYVVLVPLLLVLFFHERLNLATWAGALIALVGLILLSVRASFTFSAGDSLEVLGAVFWALHVIVISRAVKKVNIFKLSLGQFLINGVLNLVLGLLFESSSLPGLREAWWAVLYTGVLSVAVGYTLQVAGQKHAPPTDVALILSMESVFAALSGYIFLGETLSILQITGCGLILAASIFVQVWNR